MDKYNKSIDLLKNFLSTNSREEILSMMEKWDIKPSKGITLSQYFENFDQAFDYDEMLRGDQTEDLINTFWKFSAPVSVDLGAEPTQVQSIYLENKTDFTSECKGGYAA
jgi:hypothetical protein